MSAEQIPFVERNRKPGDYRHGTPAGARRHAKDGELPCDACRAAKTEYDQRYKAAPEVTRRARLHAKAQGRANTALKHAHPEEYRRLYLEAKEQILREVEEQ